MVSSRPQVLSLFRLLLRAAGSFKDYNIREYSRRRTIDGFCQNQVLFDPSSDAVAFSDDVSQLEVIKRQALVYGLYAPRVKSIMEIKGA